MIIERSADLLQTQCSPAPRFSWPMRFFLGFLLLDIVGHSFMALYPYADWMQDKEIPRLPRPLTSIRQWRELADTEPPLDSGRAWDTLDSLWDFWRPWPAKEARMGFSSCEDWGLFALGWTGSRLDFINNLLGIRERWTMFSPTVDSMVALPRALLVFADGSTQVARSCLDPEDLTCFARWLKQKQGDNEKYLFDDSEYRRGYFNHLHHQHPTSKSGAPLQRIYLYSVRYEFPPTAQDIAKVFSKQNGPPQWDALGPLYEFDRAGKSERKLTPEERKAVQKSLGPSEGG
ncbi:MAG: hypothetical protein HY040_09415 [Planctomycetes bacterium]|nr:hypothetical protein [Planctomycetota bacterium]